MIYQRTETCTRAVHARLAARDAVHRAAASGAGRQWCGSLERAGSGRACEVLGYRPSSQFAVMRLNARRIRSTSSLLTPFSASLR